MPPSVKVFGVLQLVFGTIGFVSSGFGLVMVAIMFSDGNEISDAFTQGFMISFKEGYPTVLAIISLLTLALSVFQIVCGIGLLKSLNWGRIGSLCFAVLSILISLASTTLTIGMMKDDMFNTVSIVGSVVGFFFNLILPGCILFFLTRPAVVEALQDR